MVIFVVVSPPVVLSSRPYTEGGTKMADDTETQGLGTDHTKRFGDQASGFSVEASARVVPTGPDPLHHHSNPSGP
ncbi:hypothetical protein F0562_001422 [Nyssa sinensis]|uniref:Uncharacterized protein n=1 Tax=Nyssa sinensis TaxID=561372 RepID=A0A5J5C6H0_9ASTE|nr:hypothetical protein F0562_001422 [Nyssa sinensis]